MRFIKTEVVKQEGGEFLTVNGNKVPLIEADGIIFVFDLTKKVRHGMHAWKSREQTLYKS
jgi:hypothetical protein